MSHHIDPGRARSVRAMFDRVSGRYDLVNRLMTFGQDRRWRRFVLRRAALTPRDRMLDLATGTGDLAFGALAVEPSARVVAADFSLPMMQVGARRRPDPRVRWVAADALALPFADESFDVVTQGYLLRNVVDVAAALAEQRRVLRPGGRVVVLETSPPRGLLRPFIDLYLMVMLPLYGRLFSGNPDAYRYLGDSTEAFLTPAELADAMRAAGFAEVGFRRFMVGTQAVHWGVKPR